MPVSHYFLRNLGTVFPPSETAPPGDTFTFIPATLVGGDTALDSPDTGTYAEFTLHVAESSVYDITMAALYCVVTPDVPVPPGATILSSSFTGLAELMTAWPVAINVDSDLVLAASNSDGSPIFGYLNPPLFWWNPVTDTPSPPPQFSFRDQTFPNFANYLFSPGMAAYLELRQGPGWRPAGHPPSTVQDFTVRVYQAIWTVDWTPPAGGINVLMPDQSWRTIGTDTYPAMLRMPDGTWRTYQSSASTWPLKVLMADGTWKTVSFSDG